MISLDLHPIIIFLNVPIYKARYIIKKRKGKQVTERICETLSFPRKILLCCEGMRKSHIYTHK